MFSPSFFLKFPQIYRKITARLFSWGKKFFLFFFLIALFLNLAYEIWGQKEPLRKLKEEVMRHPWESSWHEKLAFAYLSFNLETAEKEYQLAQEFFSLSSPSSSRSLGLQLSPWETWLNWKSQEEKAKKDFIFWEKVSRQFPDYHYAYLKLSSLSFLLGEKEKSVNFLQKILTENPGEKNALKLAEKIKRK